LVKKYNNKFRVGQGGLIEVSSDAELEGDVNQLVLCDASVGPFDVTLPRADGAGGKRFCIKKIDSSVNAVGIMPQPGQTIDGDADTTLADENQTVDLISDNENWLILGVMLIAAAAFFVLGLGARLPITLNEEDFFGFFSSTTVLTQTEADVQGMLNAGFTVKQTNLVLGINTSVAATTQVNFRQNGADIPSARITIPNGMTGKFTKSAMASIASQDLINAAIDFQGGGTFDNYVYTVECEP